MRGRTGMRFHLPEVLLDQDGPFQRAPRELARRIAIRVLGDCAFLLFDANQHFREQEALQFLPRLAVSADADRAVQAQFSEPRDHVD